MTATETTPRLGIIADLDETSYHADPTSVSASSLKWMLKSAAHFDDPPAPDATLRDAFDLGTVVHSMVLGVGSPYVAVAGDRRTKAVKEKVAEAQAAGSIVLTPDQLEQAQQMASAVLTHEVAGKLLEAGDPEVSMFADDPAYGVIRRCRWDWIDEPRGLGVDLKTTRTADPAELARLVVQRGYDMAAAYYLGTAELLDVYLDAYAHIWVEKTRPYPVVVSQLSEDFLDRGRALVQVALTRYRRCVETGEWPGYLDHAFTTLHPPAWASVPTEEIG